MSKLSFSLVFFIILSFSNAQTRALDSLKLALKNAKHDTTKCYILSHLAFTAPDNELPVFNEQLLALTERNLKTTEHSKIEYNFYQRYYATAINYNGYIANMKGDIPGALDWHHKSLKKREEIKDDHGIVQSCNDIGLIYNNQGNVEKALQYWQRSLRISQEIKDEAASALLLSNLAGLYQALGKVSLAIDYREKSLKILEKRNDKDGIARSLNNIGSTHQNQGDLLKALEYYQKSLKIVEELGNKLGVAYVLNNIASIHSRKGNFSKAVEQHQRSLKIMEGLGNKRGIAQSLNNIGAIYFKQLESEIKDSKANVSDAKVTKALEYLKKALQIREEVGDKQGIAQSSHGIGDIYFKIKQYANAEEYLNRSLKVSKELGFPESLRNASESLFEVYNATGKYQGALENYQLFIKMRDSLNNIETQRATIKQQTQYEYDKQKVLSDQKHAGELKQQEQKSIAEKNRQNIIIASVSLVLLLVGVFFVILFNRFKLTQKQKLIIEQKNNQVEEKNRETETQKHIIEEKHKEITDSINYAERIQRSFLATKETLDENLKDYFVMFKPKDVVSGDFYWGSKLNNGSFGLVTADSTGHGVPGAIMSLLNITSLEKAIETHIEPADILNATRKTIIERLKKDGSISGGKDGMDASLTVYDFAAKKLVIAAANNPVWIMRDKETIEVIPDKMPVGKHDQDSVSFTQQEIAIQSGDVVYTLTDGFPDQFGGVRGKKFMSKNLRELLAANAHLPMHEQKLLLENKFADWTGNLEQVDDVTVIGVRVY